MFTVFNVLFTKYTKKKNLKQEFEGSINEYLEKKETKWS